MTTTIEAKHLSDALKQAMDAVSQRNTIPILANLKLEAKAGRLYVTATNLDHEIRTSAACEGGDFETTAPAKMLFEAVKKMDRGKLVKMDIDGHFLKISSGRTRFTLATLPASDFPVMADAEYDHKAELTPALFDRTAWAMSNEETRYYLNGVYIHNNDGLSAVATDGHKLAFVKTDQSYSGPGVIVPKDAVAIALKLFPDGCDMEITETKVKFSADNLSLVTKTIDGTFPDYTKVIPAIDTVFEFDRRNMQDAIGRVVSISSDRSRAVKLEFANDTATVSAQSEIGTASDVIECPNCADQSIGFNGAYFQSALSVVNGDIVSMSLSGATSPARIDNAGGIFVVMPMRV